VFFSTGSGLLEEVCSANSVEKDVSGWTFTHFLSVDFLAGASETGLIAKDSFTNFSFQVVVFRAGANLFDAIITHVAHSSVAVLVLAHGGETSDSLERVTSRADAHEFSFDDSASASETGVDTASTSYTDTGTQTVTGWAHTVLPAIATHNARAVRARCLGVNQSSAVIAHKFVSFIARANFLLVGGDFASAILTAFFYTSSFSANSIFIFETISASANFFAVVEFAV